MSIPNILKSAAVIALGGFVGFASVKFFSQPNENNRGLASLTFSKLGSEQFAKSLFNIKISHEELAQSNDDFSVVTVTIEAIKSFPAGLSYSWSLPDTANLIDGELSGSLEEFSAHQTKEFRIKVKGYSREVRTYISFAIRGGLDNKGVDRDVLISSRPEDSFEYVVQEREKARTQDNAKGLKKLGRPAAKSPIDLDKVSF